MKNTTLWQSIDRLPVLEEHVYTMATEAERDLENLKAIRHPSPVLNDLQRLLENYQTKANGLPFLKAQALRWRQTDDLTERQKDLLASLDYALTLSEKVIQQVQALVRHLLHSSKEPRIDEENIAWMKVIFSENAMVSESFTEAMLNCE